MIEIYDIETLSNCFTYVGTLKNSDTYYKFVIHYSRDDREDLYNHLKRGIVFQVGFNNIEFDYPVLHYFLTQYDYLKHLSSQNLAEHLYNKAQEIIHSESYTGISENKQIIKQLDLYALWHYKNAARRTSLKDLEFAMNLENIEEMPIHHANFVFDTQIEHILEYNTNDVYATKQFLFATLGKTDNPLYKGKDKIELRYDLMKTFGISCLNYPDVKIGEQLMLKMYAEVTNQSIYDLKNKNTPRPLIKLSDCVPKWCSLKSIEYSQLLENIKNTIITTNSFKYSVIFHGMIDYFGLGGIHSCIKPGVYKSTEDSIIVDYDVASLYPSIAKSLNLYPEHLGIEFMELYAKFIDDRIAEKKKPKEERNNTLIEGYKLILNGLYGKSNEETSPFYDRLYTYKTTIAGQLFMCMWSERMVEVCPELVFLQKNTDGITIQIPKNKLELIRDVNEQLTKETTLEIEEAFYKQMIIMDVNNYIAEYKESTKEKPYIKYKGLFEIDKEFHKNSSCRIIPIALSEYFINGVDVRHTITNHKNIYDFCIRIKVNNSSKAVLEHIENNTIEGIILNRTTRCYVSNKGKSLKIYYNGSSKANRIYYPNKLTVFNKFENKDDYDINYNYYVNEANKLIETLQPKQLTLF